MFMGLIKNETIKLFSKSKTYIIILLFLALSAMIAFIAHDTEKYYLQSMDPEFRVEQLEEEIGYAEDNIRYINEDKDLSEEDRASEIRHMETYLADLQADLARAKDVLQKGEAYDWRTGARSKLETYKQQLADSPDEESRSYFEGQITLLEYHLEKDIDPELSQRNNGLNYLRLSLMVILSGFLAFGLILFAADIMSGEYNPGTLKFLLIQPVTRIKVLVSKYLVTTLSAILLIVGSQLVFVLIIGLVKGFGSPDYPVLMGQSFQRVVRDGVTSVVPLAGTGSYETLSRFLLQGLALEILFIAAMVAFINMISVISKSSVMAFTVLIGTLLGTNIVYSLSSAYRRLSPYIFLHHTNVEGILSGSIMQETGALNFTFPLSVMVLLLSTGIFLTISMIIFKKRDVLI